MVILAFCQIYNIFRNSYFIKVKKGQCDHLLLWWINWCPLDQRLSFFLSPVSFRHIICSDITSAHCQMMDVVTVNDVDLQGYKHSQTNYYIAMHVYNIIHAWDYDEAACIHTSYFTLWFNCRPFLIWIVLSTVSGETE